MDFTFKQILILNGCDENFINEKTKLKNNEKIIKHNKEWWKYFLKKYLN